MRLIPCLLLKGRSLVKTIRFKSESYIGDPLNAVKIFSQKGVDEIVMLDITATTENRPPNFDLLSDISSECFVPFAYGGGLCDMEKLKKLFSLGADKAIINSQAIDDPDFIARAAQFFGSQSIVVSIDVQKDFWGDYRVYAQRGRKLTKYRPLDFARIVEACGAGEIMVTDISRDGTWAGYDLELIKSVANSVRIPVIACGGARCLSDCLNVVRSGASAAAAGSLFVYKAKGQGVLINFPERKVLDEVS